MTVTRYLGTEEGVIEDRCDLKKWGGWISSRSGWL